VIAAPLVCWEACKIDLQDEAAQSAQLMALQQKGAELLKASDVDLVLKSSPLKIAAQQMADQQTSALKLNQVGLQTLNESIASLHKSALVVPFVPTNLLGSAILAGGASELQNMMGDISLVSQHARFREGSVTRERSNPFAGLTRCDLLPRSTGRRQAALPRIARWMDLQGLGGQMRRPSQHAHSRQGHGRTASAAALASLISNARSAPTDSPVLSLVCSPCCR
jgi:hypothetical protein